MSSIVLLFFLDVDLKRKGWSKMTTDGSSGTYLPVSIKRQTNACHPLENMCLSLIHI